MSVKRLATASLVVKESRYTLESNAEVIGSGTFGDTFKAQDRVTKDFVVIHRIPTDELSPALQKRYEQEIATIAKCRHMFVVPVVGYSLESPSIVVTEFMPGGSLEEALEQWNRLKWFDDTTRTVVALGIAKAMQYLRECGIHHGNLKPSNIMLEKVDNEATVVPRLTEFGLAEFAVERVESEYQAGDAEFTEKSDVYSYGQVLSSLLENRRNSGKAKGLEKLIKKCTSKNPKDRPGFDEIFGMFESREVMFPKADKDQVDLILKQIEVQEKHRQRKKFKALIEIDDDFAENVVEYGMNLKAQEAVFFFQTIAPHFDKNTTKDVFVPMLKVCRKLTTEKEFCEAFAKAQLHLRLPYDRRDLVRMAFDIVANIIQTSPNLLDDRTANILAYLLPGNEKMVLYLVAEYAKRFNEIENPWTLLDTILLQWKKVEEEIPAFISIFYFLCRCYPVYNEGRLRYCLDIITQLVKSKNVEVVKGALAFLAEFVRKKMPIKMSLVAKLLSQKELVNNVLLLLLAVEQVDWTEDVVDAVLELAEENSKAGLLLAKIADTSSGASILFKHIDFISRPLPNYKSTLRAVAVLMKRDSKEVIMGDPVNLATLVCQMAKSRKTADALYALNFLSVVKCNQQLIDILTTNKFFEVRNREDIQDNFGLVLTVFTNFALITNCPCFQDVIKQIKANTSKKARHEALQFLVAVSRFPDYAETLKDMNVRDMFARLVEKHEKYAQHISIIEKNITAFIQKKKRAEQNEEEEYENDNSSNADSEDYKEGVV